MPMKRITELEDVLQKLDAIILGQQRQGLQLSRLESKVDGESVVDAPITAQEINEEQEARKLMAEMKELRSKGLL